VTGPAGQYGGGTVTAVPDPNGNIHTYTLALTPTAVAPPDPAVGNFSGGLSLTGALSGYRKSRGSTVGQIKSISAAMGARPSVGSGVGAIHLTGGATGYRVSRGSGSGSLGTSSSGAVTSRVSRGSFAGVLHRMATFIGVSPSLGGGQFTGHINWSGVSSGYRKSSGGGFGLLSRTGEASGWRRSSGGGSGSLSRAGTASGWRRSLGTFIGLLRAAGGFVGHRPGSVPQAFEVSLGLTRTTPPVDVALTRSGVADVAPTRVGSLEAGITRMTPPVSVGASRAGSATINSTRVGEAEIDDTRTDGWSIGETRT
jgi:hypothetical protein